MKLKSFIYVIVLLLSFLGASGQHYKKDGTPDRRYKENKSVYSEPSYSAPSYSGTHFKKDGTPDKRYKENRSDYSEPSYSYPSSRSVRSSYSIGGRDKHGRIKRSSTAKHDFMKQTGYPHGRPGYVVDHIIPLKKGGCDCPSNMQWQTKEAAKEKDKWEYGKDFR